MFKPIILFSLLAVTCARPGATADENKANLIAAGVSEPAATGISGISEKYRDQFEALEKAQLTKQTLTDTSMAEINAFVAGQSEADQNAFKQFMGQIFVDLFTGKLKKYPSADETRSRLTAAGVSEQVTSGVLAIQDKYRAQIEAAETELEKGKPMFDQAIGEINAYVATQSEADQKAFKESIWKGILDAITQAQKNNN